MNSNEASGKDPALEIKKAQSADISDIAQLAAIMWDHPVEELAEEFKALAESPEAALFAAVVKNEIIGFAQCQLRHDYVEGCSTSPVGYLEGIYVDDRWRRQGVAGALLHACEDWARSKGCTEFASDCELDNADSLRFHQSLGFGEAGRIICFTKRLS